MKYLATILGLCFITTLTKAQTAQTISDLEAKNQKCLDQGGNMEGCEQKLYKQLDSVLNTAYQKLRAGLNPSEKLVLKADQIKWLTFRNRVFSEKKKAFEGTMQDEKMIAYNELNNIVKARTLLLIKRISANAAKASPYGVQCTEKESVLNKNGDDTITRTCTYKNYRSVTIGAPDYKGRTFWTSALYLKKNDLFVQVSNQRFFNENAGTLLKQLNKVFQNNYKKDRAAVANDSDALSCFGDKTELEPCKWDEIRIELADNGFNFITSYGLGSACLFETSTFLSTQSLKPYLRP